MKVFVPLLLLAVATGLSGCGKSETSPAPAGSPEGTSAPAASRVIEVTGNDQMRFSVDRIEVKAGEPLKIVFTNIGMLPKQAMGHNLIILKKGANAQAYATAGWRSAATDYVPADLADQVVAASKLLGPKEKDELVFNAPAEPGEYPFLCTFPGHFALMKGVMVVQ